MIKQAIPSCYDTDLRAPHVCNVSCPVFGDCFTFRLVVSLHLAIYGLSAAHGSSSTPTEAEG